METLIEGTLSRQNVILTSLQGFERSRFLLRNELVLLTRKQPESNSFSRIIHICDKDQTINRLLNETTYLPFSEFGLKTAKFYANESELNKSDSLDVLKSAQLIFCTLEYVFGIKDCVGSMAKKIANAIIVFDGLTLENIEGKCCELEKVCPTSNMPSNLPHYEFSLLYSADTNIPTCWSIILACNPPVDDVESELGCSFPIVLNDPSISRPKYKTFASILTHGPHNVPLIFNTSDKDPKIHEEVGTILEGCVERVQSGAIVVFFPSYGRMIEYHNAWQKSGLWERMKVTYGRENRAGDLFKSGLIKLVKEDKSIFLSSIRYHQDEALAEFALSLAKAVLVVGSPMPFTNDIWEARIKYNNELCNKQEVPNGRLSGSQMFKHRAIEFMNGVLKRCLNEFRYRSCGFFMIDFNLKFERTKIARELGDVQVESVEQSLTRFQNHCQDKL